MSDPLNRLNSHDERAMIRAELAELRRDIADLNESVSGLVSAWSTAKGLVSFIKWFAGLVAAVTAIWMACKEFAK